MAERYIPEHRRTQFKAKNTFKPDELRRRREEQQVEIRKAKREENLAKRRGIGTGENRPGASLGAAPDSEDENPPTESQVCRQLLLSIVPFPLPPRALLTPCIFLPQRPRLSLVMRLCAVFPALFIIAIRCLQPLTSHGSVFAKDGRASPATHLSGPTANACINTSIRRNMDWIVHYHNIPLPTPLSFQTRIL